jgi:hypothetical protein
VLALETINIELRNKGQTEIKPEECLVFKMRFRVSRLVVVPACRLPGALTRVS